MSKNSISEFTEQGNGHLAYQPLMQESDLSRLVDQVIAENDPSKVYTLVPALAKVSTAQYGAWKTQLREHFKRRLLITDLDKAVREARTARKLIHIATHQEGNGTRPVVEIGGQLRDVVQAALDTLAQANQEHPSIFVQSGRLVAVHFSEQNSPSVTPLTLNNLRNRMSQAADYVSLRATTDNVLAIPVAPPLDVVRVIADGINPIDYPFPPLMGITELPILRPDGSLYTTPGYDKITQQVYIPGDLHISPIPDCPTQEDVTWAKRTLLETWLGDFPFADDASRATALADTITAVIRPVIRGQVPLTLLDAPKQGTGKTILAQSIGVVATGRIVATNAPVNDEDEWEKKILTWLQNSPAVVIIDNIIHPLESSTLNGTLTTPMKEGRELGSNTLLTVPNRAIWFASGNNIKPGPDTARRCILCRLDAKVERPHLRKGFHIPGGVDGFLNWTMEHRAELVTAVLILTRNWYAQGKPLADITPLGSFEEWTTTVGGILQAAGVPGFLANLDSEDGTSTIDEVSAEWKAFIEAIYVLYPGKAMSCSELAKQMLGDDDQAESLCSALPGSLTKSLDSYRKSHGIERDFSNHLGHAFRTRKGQIFGSLCLEADGKDRANRVQWKVSNIEAGREPAQQSVSDSPTQELTQEPMPVLAFLASLSERSVGLRIEGEHIILSVPESMPDTEFQGLSKQVESYEAEIWAQLAPSGKG